MKADLIKTEDLNEIVLENGKIFRSKKGQSPDDFWAQIANEVDETYEDTLELSREVSVDEILKSRPESLRIRLKAENLGPLEEQIITTVLAGREQIDPPKEEKPAREGSIGQPLPQETKERLLANKGKRVKFIPQRSGEELEGTIRGLMYDKRVGYAYYRILDENGKAYHKRVTSSDLYFV